MNYDFKNGDLVVYAGGQTMYFVGLHPLDKTQAFCYREKQDDIHPLPLNGLEPVIHTCEPPRWMIHKWILERSKSF